MHKMKTVLGLAQPNVIIAQPNVWNVALRSQID